MGIVHIPQLLGAQSMAVYTAVPQGQRLPHANIYSCQVDMFKGNGQGKQEGSAMHG